MHLFQFISFKIAKTNKNKRFCGLFCKTNATLSPPSPPSPPLSPSPPSSSSYTSPPCSPTCPSDRKTNKPFVSSMVNIVFLATDQFIFFFVNLTDKLSLFLSSCGLYFFSSIYQPNQDNKALTIKGPDQSMLQLLYLLKLFLHIFKKNL